MLDLRSQEAAEAALLPPSLAPPHAAFLDPVSVPARCPAEAVTLTPEAAAL